MLKRQDSSLSSSRRQAAAATPPPETRRSKAVGCMSGIVQLFSKYQNSNRRLTFGRKHEKRKAASSPMKAKRLAVEEETTPYQISDANRLTCDAKLPRSPTIPPEIRRSKSPSSQEDSRTPSSLVARLMGLEDISTATTDSIAFEEDRITKKRQRLLQALEKCNEDLEALKEIIRALQTGGVSLDLQPRGHFEGGNADSSQEEPCVIKCTNEDAEERDIQVCTAAELPRSAVGGFSVAESTNAVQVIPQQRKPTAAKKPGEDDELPIAKLLNKSTFTAEYSLLLRHQEAAAVTPRWSCSQAVIKSVEEVCGDIAWGEKREMDRIGVALHDHVWRELVEDFVNEMIKSWSSTRYSLPLEACKRRLCF